MKACIPALLAFACAAAAADTHYARMDNLRLTFEDNLTGQQTEATWLDAQPVVTWSYYNIRPYWPGDMGGAHRQSGDPSLDVLAVEHQEPGLVLRSSMDPAAGVYEAYADVSRTGIWFSLGSGRANAYAIPGVRIPPNTTLSITADAFYTSEKTIVPLKYSSFYRFTLWITELPYDEDNRAVYGNFRGSDPSFADVIGVKFNNSSDEWLDVNVQTGLSIDAGTGFTAPIPEPGTYALMGLGLIGLAWTRRGSGRQRRSPG